MCLFDTSLNYFPYPINGVTTPSPCGRAGEGSLLHEHLLRRAVLTDDIDTGRNVVECTNAATVD